MTWFTVFWIVWASVLAVGFAVVEGIAYAGKRQRLDTLSRNIQWLVLREKRIRYATLLLWVAFSVWFSVHIWG